MFQYMGKWTLKITLAQNYTSTLKNLLYKSIHFNIIKSIMLSLIQHINVLDYLGGERVPFHCNVHCTVSTVQANYWQANYWCTLALFIYYGAFTVARNYLFWSSHISVFELFPLP